MADDVASSCGFCIFNNVAAAALHALYEYSPAALRRRRRARQRQRERRRGLRIATDDLTDAGDGDGDGADALLLSARTAIERVAIIDLDGVFRAH